MISEHSSLLREKEEDLARQRSLAKELKHRIEEKEAELKTVHTFRVSMKKEKTAFAASESETMEC